MGAMSFFGHRLTSSFSKNIYSNYQQKSIDELTFTNLHPLLCFLRTNVRDSFFMFSPWARGVPVCMRCTLRYSADSDKDHLTS